MAEGASPPLAGAETQLLAEHQRIRDLLRAIEASADLPELLRRLAEARPVLAAHFLAEEAADGFYDWIRSLAPRQLGLVDCLQAEHRRFLAELDGLAERARACLAGPVAALLAEAQTLVGRVRAHEAREDELLLDALYTDLGHGE